MSSARGRLGWAVLVVVSVDIEVALLVDDVDSPGVDVDSSDGHGDVADDFTNTGEKVESRRRGVDQRRQPCQQLVPRRGCVSFL